MRHLYTTKDRRDLEALPAYKVAEALGVSIPAIWQARRRMGVVSSVRRGRQPVLCAEDVAALFELRAAGFTYSDIGHLKSMSESGVRNAMKRAAEAGFEVYQPRRKIYVNS